MTPVSEEEIAEVSPAPRITEASITDKIEGVQYYVPPDTTLTLCIIKMWNGFLVVGESACASPENFDRLIGQRIAFQDAFRKIWALEGYRLRAELSK